MARVTVEDCIEILPNRFELVAVASQRARQIASGSPITVSRDNDKDSVVSLREIAEKTISAETLKEEVIVNHQKYGKADVIDEEQAQIGASEAAEEMANMIHEGVKIQDEDDDEDLNMMEFGDEDIADLDD